MAKIKNKYSKLALALTISLTLARTAFAADITNGTLAPGDSCWGGGTTGATVNALAPNVSADVDGANGILTVTHTGAATNNIFRNKWTDFSIPSTNRVDFVFDTANQVSLNYIVGGNPSNILGKIENSGVRGTVFLINPNGVLFGPVSSVNVGSLVVSTLSNPIATASTIALSRGTYTPAGILIQSGASISADKSIGFLSNAINAESGSYIGTTGTNNIAFLTGDGYTFQIQNGTPKLDVDTLSSSLSELIPYSGTTSETAKIDIAGSGIQARRGKIDLNGNISGHQVTMTAFIDSTLDSTFLDIVNLGGMITANAIDASGVAHEGGVISVLAANFGNNNSYDFEIQSNSYMKSFGSTMSNGTYANLPDLLNDYNSDMGTSYTTLGQTRVPGVFKVGASSSSLGGANIANFHLQGNMIQTNFVDLTANKFSVSSGGIMAQKVFSSEKVPNVFLKPADNTKNISNTEIGATDISDIYNSISGGNIFEIGGNNYTGNINMDGWRLSTMYNDYVNLRTRGNVSLLDFYTGTGSSILSVDNGATMGTYDAGNEAASVLIERLDTSSTIKMLMGNIYSNGTVKLIAPDLTVNNTADKATGSDVTVTGPVTVNTITKLAAPVPPKEPEAVPQPVIDIASLPPSPPPTPINDNPIITPLGSIQLDAPLPNPMPEIENFNPNELISGLPEGFDTGTLERPIGDSPQGLVENQQERPLTPLVNDTPHDGQRNLDTPQGEHIAEDGKEPQRGENYSKPHESTAANDSRNGNNEQVNSDGGIGSELAGEIREQGILSVDNTNYPNYFGNEFVNSIENDRRPQNEFAADAGGVEHAQETGYNPAGMAGFLMTINRLEHTRGRIANGNSMQINSAFSFRHPKTLTRIKKIKEQLGREGKISGITGKARYDEIKRKIK